MLRRIMLRSHELARMMEGDYQARLALALRIAWKEERGKEEVKVNFKGTEKQIKFANDIWEKTIGRTFEELELAIGETEYKYEETREKAYKKLEETKEKLKEMNAGDFIGKWKWYLDEPFIRVLNDAQDWLGEYTGIRVSGRAWETLKKKYYLDI